MAGLRSKPLLIAPLIPAWAMIGIFVSESVHGSMYFLPFLILWSLLALLLFGYILREMLAAKRKGKSGARAR